MSLIRVFAWIAATTNDRSAFYRIIGGKLDPTPFWASIVQVPDNPPDRR
jgi:hypothetical protein